MKIRLGFVSNSSSSSFLVAIDKNLISYMEMKRFLNYIPFDSSLYDNIDELIEKEFEEPSDFTDELEQKYGRDCMFIEYTIDYDSVNEVEHNLEKKLNEKLILGYEVLG